MSDTSPVDQSGMVEAAGNIRLSLVQPFGGRKGMRAPPQRQSTLPGEGPCYNWNYNTQQQWAI